MSTLTPTAVTLEDLIDVTSDINVLNDGIKTQAVSPRTKDLEVVTVQVKDDPLAPAEVSGTADGTTASKLVDSTADFVTDGVAVGWSAVDTVSGLSTLVTAVDSLTTLSVADDIFIATDTYKLLKPAFWSQKNLLGEWVKNGNQSGTNKLVAYTLPVDTNSTVVGEIVYPIALAAIGTYPPTT